MLQRVQGDCLYIICNACVIYTGIAHPKVSYDNLLEFTLSDINLFDTSKRKIILERLVIKHKETFCGK